MSWLKLRREIYVRDGGICRACGLPVGRVWDAGHLQDRITGGDDSLDNLVLMCARCNRTLKPIHRERGEALAWMAEQHHPTPIDWQPIWNLMRGHG